MIHTASLFPDYFLKCCASNLYESDLIVDIMITRILFWEELIDLMHRIYNYHFLSLLLITVMIP
jgi:hypothetical protein